MSDFLKYVFYILRHKHYVAVECFKRGLVWCAITHDMSKFRPSEFFPYMRFFYSQKGQPCIPIIKDRFNQAWLDHIHRNNHHWQYYILYERDQALTVLPMPRTARIEMICDWIGAGRAQGHGNDVREWYAVHYQALKLHPTTRELVERDIGYTED
jgi:hypothetical protein